MLVNLDVSNRSTAHESGFKLSQCVPIIMGLRDNGVSSSFIMAGFFLMFVTSLPAAQAYCIFNGGNQSFTFYQQPTSASGFKVKIERFEPPTACVIV